MVSCVIFENGAPLPPGSLSPKGARGELILLPSPPWGRGWLNEASSSAEVRRVRGSRSIVNSNMGHHTRIRQLFLAVLLVLAGLTTRLQAQFGPLVMPSQAPQARSQEELDAYLEITTTTDPWEAIRKANIFTSQFPKSELLGIAYQHQMHACQQVGNFNGMLAAGQKALVANPDNLNTLLTLAPAMALEAAHRPGGAALLAQAEDYAQRALRGIEQDSNSKAVDA